MLFPIHIIYIYRVVDFVGFPDQTCGSDQTCGYHLASLALMNLLLFGRFEAHLARSPGCGYVAGSPSLKHLVASLPPVPNGRVLSTSHNVSRI